MYALHAERASPDRRGHARPAADGVDHRSGVVTTFTSSPLPRPWPPTCWTAFCATSASTRSPRASARRAPSTPGQLDLSRVLVEELHAIGLADAAPGRERLRHRHAAPGEGPVDRADRARRHESRRAGRGRRADRAPPPDGARIELPRGRTVPTRPRSRPPPGGRPRHRRPRPATRCSAPTTRRASSEIMAAVAPPGGAPGAPAPEHLRICLHPRRGDRRRARRSSTSRPSAPSAPTRSTGPDLGELQDETFAAEEVIAHDHRRRRPPRAGPRTCLVERRRGSRPRSSPRSPDDLTPGAHRRPRRLHPRLRARPAPAGLPEVRAIVRDFDDDRLAAHTRAVRAHRPRRSCAGTPRRQARVVRDAAVPEHAIASSSAFPRGDRAAEEALRARRASSRSTPIRGSTDGSRLSAMGLPTPNLFTGGHDYHSRREWASLQEMAAASATVVRLAAGVGSRWTRHPAMTSAMPRHVRGEGTWASTITPIDRRRRGQQRDHQRVGRARAAASSRPGRRRRGSPTSSRSPRRCRPASATGSAKAGTAAQPAIGVTDDQRDEHRRREPVDALTPRRAPPGGRARCTPRTAPALANARRDAQRLALELHAGEQVDAGRRPSASAATLRGVRAPSAGQGDHGQELDRRHGRQRQPVDRQVEAAVHQRASTAPHGEQRSGGRSSDARHGRRQSGEHERAAEAIRSQATPSTLDARRTAARRTPGRGSGRSALTTK